MGLIVNIYKKNFLKRYDRDEAVPYYSAKDFPGLKCTRGSFLNSCWALESVAFIQRSRNGLNGSMDTTSRG